MKRAARAKSTDRRTDRSFLSASQASTCNRWASTCRSSSPRASALTPPRSLTAASLISSARNPDLGTTGRRASSAAPIAAISRRHISTREIVASRCLPSALDRTATPAASKPPAIPHNAVAFVSARCTSTKARSVCPCSRCTSEERLQGSCIQPTPSAAVVCLSMAVVSLLAAANACCLRQGTRSAGFLTSRPSEGGSRESVGESARTPGRTAELDVSR